MGQREVEEKHRQNNIRKTTFERFRVIYAFKKKIIDNCQDDTH